MLCENQLFRKLIALKFQLIITAHLASIDIPDTSLSYIFITTKPLKTAALLFNKPNNKPSLNKAINDIF